ncbi:ABC transporter substrate-binding protein [Roseomonas marmotae]|uniref:ABC transporter substrate-binding protein n=1 Tax=Roseomonas marmotae TaxID=2768161 RepID=A0ABS3KG13_9PROT|nr:ABC transporter substrate-binding protein [Roseomonas marmotae]MBO1076408.1 ABC transporter substrate-binding protein [Roseomonas marmotae]QTI79385.1 ABC transporter substrate-binding protein [Roseomonas marmotae]
MNRRAFLAAASAASLFSYDTLTRAFAATPKNMLVVAQLLDNVTNLDPQENFEAVAAEINTNVYQKLLRPNPDKPEELEGDLAESWTVSDDGRLLTFQLRTDAVFASGTPVTAEDVAFSLGRAVKLNKAPAFIINQFGFTPDNVDERIRATGPHSLTVALDGKSSPAFVLYCLSSNVGSVVDKKLVLSHAQGDDLGNGWLKSNSAGSGDWILRSWKPSESAILEASPAQAKRTNIRRIVLRHVVDPSAQMLLLRNGDADVARNLTTEQLRALQGDPDYTLVRKAAAALVVMQLNTAHPQLAKPQVRQAIKHALDYQGIQQNLASLTHAVHQSFLPLGFPAAVTETPFRKDVARARALMAEAGAEGGFELVMDHYSYQPYNDIAQAMQADLAEIGIRLRLMPGENRQVLTKTRARQHEAALTAWGADYFDPNSNAEAFCVNTDNGPDARNRTLAWRNSWKDDEFTRRAQEALAEPDATKRLALYEQLQRDHMQRSPFVIMLQTTETAACRKGVEGVRLGTLADSNSYADVRKA